MNRADDRSRPAAEGDAERTVPLIELVGVAQVYQLPRTTVVGRRPELTALQDISFAVHAGEAIGVVGESGSGKSTLTRILVGDERPATGTVLFEGADLWASGVEHLRRFRRAVQIVLQNPRSSFDPRMPVGKSLQEPLRSLRVEGEHAQRIERVLDQVGLDPGSLRRYPHEFSGGQLQRLAIARALLPGPRVLIADEPVSALDVSVQAQVLNLLKDLVDDLGLSLVLIAHDLSVVAYTTGRVAVLAEGRIVEEGRPVELFTAPQAAATRNLADAVLTVAGGIAGTSLQ